MKIAESLSQWVTEFCDNVENKILEIDEPGQIYDSLDLKTVYSIEIAQAQKVEE